MAKKKETNKKESNSKKFIAGATIAVASLATGGFFWLSSGKGNNIQVPSYTAARVVDGDTFITTEEQYIRISSTEAPKIENCGGKEAKEALEKMIMGKPLYLKVIFNDNYKRLVSYVYTDTKFVNEEMIKNGYTDYYRGSPGDIGETLKKAGDQARNDKKGIYSAKCTQMENPKKPSCNVKGNIGKGKIYFTPNCRLYSSVQLQLYKGDQWFCTEKEAQKAGFRIAQNCP